ncbi:MAG: hypothetical protein R3192_11120 [Woeseiaceae bacterium]|nr:hypothetical protein [Woeseiaceae bacterium]
MSISSTLQPVSAEVPSTAQSLFVRYLLAVLIDLVVLNLFNEYSENVEIETFTISLLAAVLLQILLKLTLVLEHRVAAWFKAKPGTAWTVARFLSAWLILFGSKFVILEAINIAFGDGVRFFGVLHGVLTLIVVLIVMILAEELVARVYRRLASWPDAGKPPPAGGDASTV